MKKPVRTTIFFGLISAILVLPSSWLLTGPLGWSAAIKLVLWVDLALYAVLLSRWSGKGAPAVVFPLALLLGVALWPGVHAGFFLMGLGVFCWIRSGACFTGAPLRSLCAEITTVAGSALLIVMWGPGSAFSWAIALWLFFLFQSLYFFMVPVKGRHAPRGIPEDPFERARQKLEDLLHGLVVSG